MGAVGPHMPFTPQAVIDGRFLIEALPNGHARIEDLLSGYVFTASPKLHPSGVPRHVINRALSMLQGA